MAGIQDAGTVQARLFAYRRWAVEGAGFNAQLGTNYRLGHLLFIRLVLERELEAA